MQYDVYSPDDTIRKIIGRNKIKYTLLTELINNQINSLETFIINVDSILIDLHKFLDPNKEFDKYDLIYPIASSLVNIVAHYRYYFSINGWYPNIYILADKNDSNPNIKDALNITSIILKYIDNSYFIDTSGLNTGIIIKYFLKKKCNNLILSRDDFDLMHLSKNTAVIKANKEKSKIYFHDNWQSVLSGNYKDDYSIISYKLINLILCFAGGHGRPGVPKLGIRTIMKKILKAIKKDMIINDYYSNIYDFLDDMKDLLSKYDPSKAISNFNIYDVNRNYSSCITKATEKRLDSYIEDKFSKKDLMMLNTRYFTGLNSLMLNELMTKPKTLENTMKW